MAVVAAVFSGGAASPLVGVALANMVAGAAAVSHGKRSAFFCKYSYVHMFWLTLDIFGKPRKY